jgi:hypothetical protein
MRTARNLAAKASAMGSFVGKHLLRVADKPLQPSLIAPRRYVAQDRPNAIPGAPLAVALGNPTLWSRSSVLVMLVA